MTPQQQVHHRLMVVAVRLSTQPTTRSCLSSRRTKLHSRTGRIRYCFGDNLSNLNIFFFFFLILFFHLSFLLLFTFSSLLSSLISHFSFLISHFSFLISHLSSRLLFLLFFLPKVRLANHTSTKQSPEVPSGGGAIFIDSTTKLQADNCTFENNLASYGGALFVAGTAVAEITNSNIRFNNVSQEGNGGGVYCTDDSVCRISSSVVESNLAIGGIGGGIYCNKRSQLFSQDNYYTGNTATYGGAHYGDDASASQLISDQFEANRALNNGGVAEISAESTVTWKYCRFSLNKASGTLVLIIRGGIRSVIDSCLFESFGDYRNNEAMVGALAGDIYITNSTFKNGFAASGGALGIGGSIKKFLMEDSLFIDNTAFDIGALSVSGLSLDNFDVKTDIVIRKTRFENNRAISSGGSIGGQGANNNFNVKFEDCDFVNNVAGVNGGVGFFLESGIWTFENCRFVSNRGQNGGTMGVSGTARVVVNKSNFESNSGLNGGALFATSEGEYRIESSTFQSNKATVNGGVFYSDFLARVCPQFVRSKFVGNVASGSGGGLFFDMGDDHDDGDSLISCAREYSFCDGCSFVKNKVTLGYGTDYATSPTTLVPIGWIMDRLYPSQTFNSSFEVKDAFNQTLLGFIDMQVNLKVKKDIYVTGTLTRQPTRQGVVVFDDVIFGVEPGSKVPIHFTSDPTTTDISDHIAIDRCSSDQLLYVKNNYYYCLDQKEPDDVARVLIYIAVALILALAFVVLLLLIWKRREKPIHNATPSMCYTIVMGVVLCAISVTMWTKAEDAMCALRGWLLALGLTMIFGAIFVRAYRLLWIFKKTVGDIHAKRRVITNLDLGIGVGAQLTVVIIVLVVWMIVAPPNKRDVIEIDVSGEEADNTITYECDYGYPSSVFIILLIVMEALLLAFNCVVAFLTRNIPSNFNESKHIAFTMYNAAIMMTVAIVLVIVFNDDPTAILIIVALTILFQCLVTLVVLFAPKLYLSFLSKSSLIKHLTKEKEDIQQEIRMKEREATELKSSFTSSGTTATAADTANTNTRGDTRDSTSH
eukprot:TRINITY_DN4896_c0_g1_i3.p1 TRINITY_DN4896_c0_g1~~TRINITY_DN4896_c0_g1_i3.p1  ORF type:complete len:1045 (-),score=275.20 TRINITY_DN4896_c0_g1_i3:1905-5039(-)